jgi:hypothetical protein
MGRRTLDYAQMTEYIKAIHRDDDGLIAIAAKGAYGFKQRMCHLDELLDTVSDTYSTKTNLYTSVNSFYLPIRQEKMLRRINAIYADIDCDSRFYLSLPRAIERLRLELYEDSCPVPPPSLMIDSGGGVHLYWLIEDAPKQARPFWLAVAEQMMASLAKMLEPYPFMWLDSSVSKDSQRVMRLPGTWNQKSGRMCQIVENKSLDVYRLDELRDKYGFGHLEPSKRARYYAAPTTNPFYPLLLRDMDILRDLRKNAAQTDWCRRRMTFMYRHFALLAGYSPNEAVELVKEFNRGYASPLPEESVLRSTASAQKSFDQGLYYRYKTETIVEELKVTKVEMEQLRVLLDSATKKCRQAARRRARYAVRVGRDLHGKALEMNATRAIVAHLVAAGMTQSQIAEKTGYSLSKVKRLRAEYVHAMAGQQTAEIVEMKAVSGGSFISSQYCVCSYTRPDAPGRRRPISTSCVSTWGLSSVSPSLRLVFSTDKAPGGTSAAGGHLSDACTKGTDLMAVLEGVPAP